MKKDKLHLKYVKCPTEANKTTCKCVIHHNKLKTLRIKAEFKIL